MAWLTAHWVTKVTLGDCNRFWYQSLKWLRIGRWLFMAEKNTHNCVKITCYYLFGPSSYQPRPSCERIHAQLKKCMPLVSVVGRYPYCSCFIPLMLYSGVYQDAWYAYVQWCCISSLLRTFLYIPNCGWFSFDRISNCWWPSFYPDYCWCLYFLPKIYPYCV